jgi:hypothetical protein
MAEMAPASPLITFQDISRWDDSTAFEVFVVDETATAEDVVATDVVATLFILDALVPMPCPADVVLTACNGVEVVLNTAEEAGRLLVSAEEVIEVAAALGRPPVIVTAQTMKEKSRISGRKVSVEGNEYD